RTNRRTDGGTHRRNRRRNRRRNPPLFQEPTATPEPTAEPIPEGPLLLRSGSFGAGMADYSAVGTASLVRLPDGQTVIQLAGFQTQWGPDLFVFLSEHPAPRSDAEVRAGSGGYNLGRLSSHTTPEQTYVVPADVNPEQYRSVVVYCRAFSQVFSSAELIADQ
ncbi:MAG: DM13 domain-containing protein, partial [Chloroflexaceae bacterium]|nr:DM13 domain-containing protein [Chloroflexaceae bacterium]